jgi:hypothetical protein
MESAPTKTLSTMLSRGASSSPPPNKKAARAKPHFTKRKAKNIRPTMDILEIIATTCLYKTPVMLLKLMMTNKELYNRVLGNHGLWKKFYRQWEMLLGDGSDTGPFAHVEMVLPNLFGMPVKV